MIPLGNCGAVFSVPKSKFENHAVFQDTFWRLCEIALNEFEWVNLPKTCDERFLELILLFEGSTLVFRKMPENALLNWQYTGRMLSMYHIPTIRNAFSINAMSQECDPSDSVIVYNNRTRYPTAFTLFQFADRLTRLQRTIDVNVNALKTTRIIRGSKQQKKSLEAMLNKIDSFEESVMVDESQNLDDKFGIFNTDSPIVFPELYLQKQKVWREALSFLGVNNSNTDKAERMTDDEVRSNNDELIQNRFTRLVCRQEAAKLINERFPDLLDGEVSVRFRRGGENQIGNLHDGPENSNGSTDGENKTNDV